MNNQKLVETLRSWADKLAEMPEAGDAINVRLSVYRHYEFNEADAAELISAPTDIGSIDDHTWAVSEVTEFSVVTIFTTEEKARQICPPVPLENVQVPTEVLSDVSGQEVSQ